MNSREKEQIRYRVYEILEVRSGPDPAARVYDFVYLITIILNLTVSVLYTYEKYRMRYGKICSSGIRQSEGCPEIYSILYRNCGHAFLSPLLSADLLPVRCGGFPDAENHAGIPAVPDQFLL